MSDESLVTGRDSTDAEATLDHLERLFDAFAGGLEVPEGARARARRRAASILDAAGAAGAAAHAEGIAALAFAADSFGLLAVELAAHPPDLRALVDRIETEARIPRIALANAVLSAPHLLGLPTAVAIEVQLALLIALARLRAVAVFAQWPGGDLRHVGDGGEFEPAAPRMRRVGRSLLNRDSSQVRERVITGIVIHGRHQHRAALVALKEDRSQLDPVPLMEAAAPTLSAVLERDEQLERDTGADAEAAAATERRLARLRFDLHDGPQQDVILLGDDLRLFRSQLDRVLEDHPQRDRVLGRLDDLHALLVAIDGDLRRIAAFVQSPFLQPEPLPDALASLTDDFAARTGIDPETRLRGDFSKLTDSQQITLLGLIREALSNIREHSDASHVTITLLSDKRGVKATVTDDGRGFDPETTLVRAAREGHLGLVGMYERVRMLDGQTQIDSRPGGPTVVSVTLPPVPPRDAR
jgi:signal transduction histidine kinase